jgi:hypothetical protein
MLASEGDDKAAAAADCVWAGPPAGVALKAVLGEQKNANGKTRRKNADKQ